MTLRSKLPELLVGLGFVVLGVVGGIAASGIPHVTYADKVGPTVVPWAVSAALVVLGVLLVASALRGTWTQDEDSGPVLWKPLGLLIAGLVLNAVLIDSVGFILTSTMLFAVTAASFGSRRHLRDVSYGFTLALVAYIGFDRVLDYKIGGGIVEDLLSKAF